MPSMFTPAERRLAEAISHLTFINPFMPGRAEAERAVLGSHGTSTSRQFISCHIAAWIIAPANTNSGQSTGIYERTI